MSSQTASLQNVELAEEIEAINAIYELDTITVQSGTPSTASVSTLNIAGTGPSSSMSTRATTVKLIIPNHPHLSFLVDFDDSYPTTRPRVVGTASTASRGEGKIAVDVLEDIVQRTFQPGGVCMFEVINEAIEAFEELRIGGDAATSGNGDGKSTEDPPREGEAAVVVSPDPDTTPPDGFARLSLRETFGLDTPPDWTLSDVVTEKKSVFVGRAARVTSLEQAQAFLDHLLATEKKVAAATHNISAWRIRQKKATGSSIPGKNGASSETVTVVQDCDDDGETAAGGRLLHLMQLMDVWDVIVVVTRWYGGVLLGPDRFRIINAVGRDALLKGGFGRDDSSSSHEKTKKKGKK